jgi:hypothetical protein
MTASETQRRALLPAIAVACVGIAGCTVAQTPFPNLTDAEMHLTAALDALHRAPDRFGGHKAEAVRLIHAALNEIEQARISFR